MSWHCSRVLVEEFLAATCSDGELSVLLSSTPTPEAFYFPGKTTEHSRLSRFGMTSEPLMENLGEELLTLYRAAFPAKPIPRQLRAKTMQMISGRKCGESWQMSLPGTFLPKMSQKKPLTLRQMTLRRWVIRSDALSFQRKTWVLTTYGNDIGYLHTPTCTANYAAKSMMKWKSCREFVRVFGKPPRRTKNG